MRKGVVLFLLAILLIPLAFALSIKDLISRYKFSTSTAQINVALFSDFMIDKNNNGVNDTLVIELTTNNSNGNFIFVVNLYDKNGIVVNETNKTLGSGANKVNITFDSMHLAQSQFNYSVKVYNSTFSLKYRKDNISTQNYLNYEEGFKLLNIKDFKEDKLKINITINSTLNGTFDVIAFLSYNSSIIFAKENKSITSAVQDLMLGFDNETIKRTHYIGNFSVSSVKIGKKLIKANFTTAKYDYGDFAAKSYISGFSDSGIDTNNNNKFNNLQINTSMQILKKNDYAILLSLYDLFDNIVEFNNITSFLNAGKNAVSFNINGSRIYDKKLNGPFIVKSIELYENGTLVDKINDAYTTKNYNYNDLESPNFPDLEVEILASDSYRYGIDNITINITFKNIGGKHAFNVFTEIFDNKTISKANKSNILLAGSEIKYQINFTNISDFEISAFADINDFIEETNESNNAERLAIKLNKNPILNSINNVSVNETERIVVNLSASDANNDKLSFSINLSKFSNNLSRFEWKTTTIDSGIYNIKATVSDGFLNDSKIFKLIVVDVPDIDSDNDGINESIDKLVGNEKSVNSSTMNLSIFLNNSNNLSRIFNQNMLVRFVDRNFTILEFEFDFSTRRLNLTNLSIEKQAGNSTGSIIIKGLKMNDGETKTAYVDRINNTDGICVRDEEILAISQISSSCNSNNEFKVECDGTLQNSYICTYNSTLNKYKVEGLKHSGIAQIDYKKPASSSSASSTSTQSTSSGSGGGGGVICISDWQCSEWAECIDGIKSRKCSDKNQCAFATKPSETEKCVVEEKKISGNLIKSISSDINKRTGNATGKAIKGFSGITGKAVDNITGFRYSFAVFLFAGIIMLIGGCYVIAKYKV